MIRPSKPTDAKQVIPLIEVVFDQMEIPAFMKLPKEQLEQVFERGFLLPDYRYGYPQVTVAEEDGEIQGIAVSYPHELEAHIDDSFKPLLPELGISIEDQLFSDVESKPGEWYLDTLVVAESARGKGTGSKLIAALPEIIKERQSDAMMLSLNVDQGNPNAERLYKRAGFTKTGELMIGAHRYNHMVKSL